jgi:transposase
MSSKHYRPWNPDQMVLFPAAMRDALEEGHLVFRIMDVVSTLDISCITDRIQEKDPRGTRPYHPGMMLALLIYAYCTGIYSSRRIAAATYDMIPFRVLTGDQHPHFTVINEFRMRYLESFVDLFVQVLELCGRAGLLSLEHVSLDGSKVQANASKHKAMSYGRMGTELERLEREIRELTARAARIDAEEDELYGEGKDAQEICEELKRRQARVKRISEAKKELEEEARRAREQELRKRAEKQRKAAETESDPAEKKRKQTRARKAEEEADRLSRPSDGEGAAGEDSDLPSHKVPSTPEGKPKPEAQRNFTDPDSRIMKRDGSYLQGYNCQTVVDEANQIILAGAVSNQAPDQEHLIPMMDMVLRNTGQLPGCLSADRGYMSEDNAEFCEANGVDAYLAVGRSKHGQTVQGEEPQQESETWRAMREKVSSEEGQEVYSRRKVIVEPVFGQIKEARGFRRFSLRGLGKVACEWDLVCLCSNLLKLVGCSATATSPASITA